VEVNDREKTPTAPGNRSETDCILGDTLNANHDVDIVLARLEDGPQPATRRRSDTSLSCRSERPLPSQMRQTMDQSAARLSKPCKRGLSARRRQQELDAEFEAKARRAASTLLPDVSRPDTPAAPKDAWHAGGEDGYCSSMLRVAVRCQHFGHDLGLGELKDDACDHRLAIPGVGNADSTFRAPELVRLHAACLLFEELCQVSSPLQDTLRYLQREFCLSVFEDFNPGADVMKLTPFFVEVLQARENLNHQQKRAELAERQVRDGRLQVGHLQDRLTHLESELKSACDLARSREDRDETILSERDKLRVEVVHLQQLCEIRGDESRVLSKEILTLQGKDYTHKRELDQARQDLAAMASQAKEQEDQFNSLQHHASDLNSTLSLLKETSHLSTTGAGSPRHTQSLLQECALDPSALGTLRYKPPAPPQPSAVWSSSGGRRALKVPVVDGRSQLVMRCTAEDATGLRRPDTSGDSKAPPVLVVSGEVFAALSIAVALPHPLDPFHFKCDDDENMVHEVRREVQLLAAENRSLLELLRTLRREVKRVLNLIPEWNRDEVCGILQSVMVFDLEESMLVRPPVAGRSLIGLGDSPEVPSFLRYNGILKFHAVDPVQVLRALWLGKTRREVEAVHVGESLMTLSDFVCNVYLAEFARQRRDQMEHMYSFLVELRRHTSLADIKPGVAQMTAEDQRAGEAKLRSRLNAEFHAPSEIMYRSLLCQLHEDAYHDQTAMLVSLCHNVAALSEPLTPAHVEFQSRQDAVIGLPELSAIFRLFFPSKPREHLSSLKKILVSYARSSPLIPRRCEGDSSLPTTDQKRERLEKDIVVPISAELPSPRSTLDDVEGDPAPAEHSAAAERCVPSDRPDAARDERVVPPMEGQRPQVETGATELQSPRGHRKVELRSPREGLLSPTSPSNHEKDMPLVDVSEAFGVPLHRGAVTDEAGLLQTLVSDPSPLFAELRRQHLVESFMFVERLQRALWNIVIRSTSCGGSSLVIAEGAGWVTVKQAESALLSADHRLSVSQRRIYLLRGFAHRLPEIPGEDCSSSCSSSLCAPRSGPSVWKRGHVLHRLLEERFEALLEENPTIDKDVFVQRLRSSGVTRGPLVWRPSVHVAAVTQEAGLVAARVQTLGGNLEEFISHSLDGPEGGHLGARYEAQEVLDNLVHEFGVGYTVPMLFYRLEVKGVTGSSQDEIALTRAQGL